MASPIFIDANIPIYADGSSHPLKQPCADILRLVPSDAGSFLTDSEVFQELLHVYRSRGLWARGRETFVDFLDLMRGNVAPVQVEDVEDAAILADRYPALSARDLIHLAVMRRLGVTRIASADRGFDGIDGFERLDPADIESWRETVQ